jgi:hypothetical protein
MVPLAWLRWRVLPGFAIMAAACLASEAPPPPLLDQADPAGISTGIHIMEGAFGTPAIRSLSTFGPKMAVLAVRSGAAAPVVCAPAGAPFLSATTPALGEGGGGVTASAIPDSLFRHVYVYDSTSGSYQRTADTSGPTGGVLFLPDAVDSIGRPTGPSTNVGWLDLIDHSAGGVLALQAHVQSGTLRNADYSILPSGTQQNYTAVLAGTVTDGSHGFVFRDSTGAVLAQVTASATIDDSVDGLNLRLRATRTATDPFDNYYDLDVTFIRGPQTIRLMGSITTYCLVPSIGVAVSVNGTDFARVTNGAPAATVTRVDRKPITAAQVQAILDLIEGERRLFG